ncbi:hypothetical protein JCM11641_002989 [Rhodosporidiobolus odoratus]
MPATVGSWPQRVKYLPAGRELVEEWRHFAGNPLNRLSYLRSSPAFLTSALRSPKAKFLPLDSLALLSDAPTKEDSARHLAFLSWKDVEPYIGEADDVFKGVDGKNEDEFKALKVLGKKAEQFGKQMVSELTVVERREYFVNQPALVFLGVDERSAPESAQSLPLSKPTDSSTLESHSPYGIPLWGLDVSQISELKELALKGAEGREFGDLRAGSQTIPPEEASVAAEARALVDWNTRNKFCPSCSRPIRSVWAGWKRQCIPGAAATSTSPADPPCTTKKGVHNTSYPRTDPVVIMAVLSPDKEQILLGRQRSWPAKFYSCLAGFVESGESLEEAVKREVYEEAGIVCEEVGYHSSQPWPYPSSLMFGCWAVAAPGQTIRTDLDNELEDARYYTRAEVLKVLGSSKPLQLSREEVKRIDGKEGAEEKKESGEEKKGEKEKVEEEEGVFRMPPATAIANVLITAWANGTLFSPSTKF